MAKKQQTPAKKVAAKKVVKKTVTKPVKKEAPKKVVKPAVVTVTKKVDDSLEEIKIKKIGNKLNVKIDNVLHTVTLTSDKMATVIDLITKFNKLKSKETPTAIKFKKSIVELITPIKTQEKLKEEKIKENIKTTKKVIKKEIEKNKDSNKERIAVLKKYLGSNEQFKVDFKTTEVFINPYPVKVPDLLVDRIMDCVRKKIDYTPFIKFWELCLLNPNVIARTKLFDYLELHNLMVTKNGYFVTYRMVKTTDKKGVFTHAHNGNPRMNYKIGQVSKLNRRTECDEDGSRDCSKGLHTGSPLFIGIETKPKKIDFTEVSRVGEGYGVGVKIVTKQQNSNSYGTGYDRPSPIKTEESFDHTFGNQAVICLVNPMHVVSVPNSDTRKLRACELYFAATTTPEEVVEHLIKGTTIYDKYDESYKSIEEAEIKEMLKSANMTDLFKSKISNKKIEELQEKLNTLTVSGDNVNSSIDIAQFKAIIQSRVKKL